MNPAVLMFGMVGANAKRLIALALATLTVIVALPCIAVFAMGAEVLTFLSGVPNALAAEKQGFYMGGAVAGDTYEWGNCTYWAYAMRLWAGDPIPTSWGNANTWDDRARNDGYVVDNIPTVNAVFQSDAGKFGHVAYVIKVDAANGNWTISEMNYPTLNVVTQRTFAKSAAAYYNFIHDKKGAPEWKPSPTSIPLLNTGT